jgi:hypothetical protein
MTVDHFHVSYKREVCGVFSDRSEAGNWVEDQDDHCKGVNYCIEPHLVNELKDSKEISFCKG